MHRGDAGQALIVGIQRARYAGRAGHEPVGADFSAIRAAEQPLDVMLLAHDEVSVAFFDQRRSPNQKAIVAAGEAEVIFAGFAETPHVPSGVAGHQLCRIIFSKACQQKSDATNGAGQHATQAIGIAKEITRPCWAVFCCICRLSSARFASATDSPEKIRTLSGGGSSRGTRLQKLPPLRLNLSRLVRRQRRRLRKFIDPGERPAGVDDRLGVGSDAAFLVLRRNARIER
jgi:hypothetical protein